MIYRLTEKLVDGHYESYDIDDGFDTRISGDYDINFGLCCLENIVGKLGKLEDFEEKLGCELETVLKAMENGVYMKTEHFGIVYCETPKAVKYKSGWKLLVHGAVLGLQACGKTWALTKEELL